MGCHEGEVTANAIGNTILYWYYSSPPLTMPHLLQWNSDLTRGVASLIGDNLM